MSGFCNCDTGSRSGKQVHDRWCGGDPQSDPGGFDGAGALVSEYIARQWVAAERERCAKIAEELADPGSGEQIKLSDSIATKIRSGSLAAGADGPVNVRDDYFPHGALYYPRKYWELVDGEVRRIRSGE